jgi:hypothetical protein
LSEASFNQTPDKLSNTVKPQASTWGALSFGSVFFMRIKKMNARHGSGFLNLSLDASRNNIK